MNDAKHQHLSSRELIYTELVLENCVRQTVFLYKPHLSWSPDAQTTRGFFIHISIKCPCLDICYPKLCIMQNISCSLFHFCDNHGPTVLLSTKIVHEEPSILSLFLKKAELEKTRAYQCSNCFSLGEDTPYIISSLENKRCAVSGRSLFQSDEEASRINHIGKKICPFMYVAC